MEEKKQDETKWSAFKFKFFSRPFQCDVCGTGFRTRATLERHILCGHKEGLNPVNYNCKDCDMTFSYLSTLRKHERSNHEVSVSHYLCL